MANKFGPGGQFGDDGSTKSAGTIPDATSAQQKPWQNYLLPYSEGFPFNYKTDQYGRIQIPWLDEIFPGVNPDAPYWNQSILADNAKGATYRDLHRGLTQAIHEYNDRYHPLPKDVNRERRELGLGKLGDVGSLNVFEPFAEIGAFAETVKNIVPKGKYIIKEEGFKPTFQGFSVLSPDSSTVQDLPTLQDYADESKIAEVDAWEEQGYPVSQFHYDSPEEKRRIAHKRRIRDRPYSYILDAEPTSGSPEEPNAMSRLGMYGLIPEPGSYDTWHMYDENGRRITQCAKFANRFSSAVGKPTAGDAWTSTGIFGDSLIYGDEGKRTNLPQFLNVPRMLGKRISNINRDRLETGDIVDLYGVSSRYGRRAAREGRGNSHSGRIYKPEGSEGPTYVIHNVNGDILVEPLGNFTRLFSPWGITRISRPAAAPKQDINYEIIE